MRKSLQSPEYARLIAQLAAERKAAGVRQQIWWRGLQQPQSFVARYEGGKRRLDVIEFITVSHALDADPVKLFQGFVAGNSRRRQGKNRRNRSLNSPGGEHF